MRRGSLEFWPHRRAKRPMPRIRHWPALSEPALLGFVGFKAGMTHVMQIDDTNSASKGTEVAEPVTIIETPKVYVYGVRFYAKDPVTRYTRVAEEVYDKALAQNIGIKKTNTESIESAKSKIESFSNLSLLAYVSPMGIGFGTKKLMRFEIGLGGTKQEKLALAEKTIGKEIKAADVFKPGEYVDIIGISKGKGWEGPVARFGVAKQRRKTTGKVRHVGTLGPFHPPKVLYSVPMAGHKGHNYRTELNKRIMKIGAQSSTAEIEVKGGFPHYGTVKNDYIIVHGSVPGAPGILLRLRKSLRPTKKGPEPKIRSISLSSKIGA
ncbi:MAG: 50S ribosomal protein L3 [Candidatus Micrarchaeaceae archaeon]